MSGFNGEFKAFRDAADVVNALELRSEVKVYLNAVKDLKDAEDKAKSTAKKIALVEGYEIFPKEHNGVKINVWTQSSTKFDLSGVPEGVITNLHGVGVLDVNAKAYAKAREEGKIESEVDSGIRSEYVKSIASKVELVK